MITIITDSSSCLKKEEAIKMGIKVVPMSYTVNERTYFETYCDQNGDFYPLLNGSATRTTSQPNLASFLSVFEEELAKGNEILCITISSRLSSTYATAHMAAKQTGNAGVFVFDSHLTAGGQYLLIKEAKKLTEQNLKVSEIIEKLTEIRKKISITFAVDDIAPLRSSGRIGFVRMSVGTILNIKPILLCTDGFITATDTARGTTELTKKLFHSVPSTAKEVVINYIGNERTATNLYNALINTYKDIKLTLRKAGPVIGIHLGTGAIGVAHIGE